MNIAYIAVDSSKFISIQEDPNLSVPSEPSLPVWTSSTSVHQKIISLQKYIEEFQYNYTNKQYVDLKKSRGTRHLLNSAKEIISAALPIQCVEATYIGIYLTSTLPQVDRFPVSFKSRLNNCSKSIHRHMVLVIRYQNKYGAIGISRRSNLMWKNLNFNSLSDLIHSKIMLLKRFFTNQL